MLRQDKVYEEHPQNVMLEFEVFKLLHKNMKIAHFNRVLCNVSIHMCIV